MTTLTEGATPLTVAAESAITPGAMLLNVGGALVLVLLLIVAGAWLFRRSGFQLRGLQKQTRLTIKESHSLGGRERLLLVEIADQRLLLGVTASQITHLASLEKPQQENVPESGVATTDFRTLLAGMLKGRKS